MEHLISQLFSPPLICHSDESVETFSQTKHIISNLKCPGVSEKHTLLLHKLSCSQIYHKVRGFISPYNFLLDHIFAPGFAAFTTFRCTSDSSLLSRRKVKKSFRRQFFRSVCQKENTIYFDHNICAVLLLFLVMSWEQRNTFSESF